MKTFFILLLIGLLQACVSTSEYAINQNSLSTNEISPINKHYITKFDSDNYQLTNKKLVRSDTELFASLLNREIPQDLQMMLAFTTAESPVKAIYLHNIAIDDSTENTAPNNAYLHDSNAILLLGPR
jgi:hypothetical protein